MASQYQTANTCQEEKDHRLAILIQQQETLAAQQLGKKSGSHYIQNNGGNIEEAIRKGLLIGYSSHLKERTAEIKESGDLDTDGPAKGKRSSSLLTLPLSGTNSSPQVKGQSFSLMSSRRARRFEVPDTIPMNGTDNQFYNPDNESDDDRQHNEYTIPISSDFSENEETSVSDEEIYEPQGASNERRRSLGNNEEDEISREIAELLKIGAASKSEAESMQENHKHKFRLNNMTKWQRNNEDQGLQPFVFDTDGIPINWTEKEKSTNHRPGHSMDVQLIELHPGQMEYDKILDEFTDTGIQITRIERIQNLYLLDRFKSEMEDTARRRHPGFDLNIRYLYHGTKADKSRICEEGLDQRLSRMGYFGKGIYFSDNPLKCVYYTEDMDSLGDAYILKCRVILGDSKCFPEGQYDIALKREPEKENVRPGTWRFYDSVVGCPRDYNEFVVYENRRAMIEYIISFKIRPEVAAAMSNTTSASVAERTGGEGEPFDDNHLDRIRQVRESVRKKRCQDRGIAYTEPNQQKKQQDDQMWNKLQMLHGVKPTEVNLEKKIPGASEPSEELDYIKIYNTLEPVTMENLQDIPSHRGDAVQGGNYYQDPDPVEQVMSELLQEFLGVTDTEDVDVAKYYITLNQMNVNNAIMNYYNDLP
ncbi:uncharacterized protein LOC132561101 [Ylistrum balloti]|uniref:uncharacterized protein LOC132561101 n=1 Tax=Ylistrum balloti TaxID=509963 RepID=UPI002905C87F|nr:uncharacterized protein LOC132561101 [Ylistrum balloti]